MPLQSAITTEHDANNSIEPHPAILYADNSYLLLPPVC